MVKVKCDNCGEVLLITPYRFKHQKHHFCKNNNKCYGEWISRNKRGENHPRYVEKIKVLCDNCGEKLEIYPRQLLISEHHFCKNKSKCYGEWIIKNKSGINSPYYNRIKIKCDNCGRKILKFPCFIKRNKHNFCDTRCEAIWKSKFCSGKNSWNYIHGESNFPYTDEFDEKCKEEIRKRDGYKCQLCFITQKKSLIKWHEKLSIHHADFNKNHANPRLLISLCKSCNAKVNFNRDYWFAYFSYILEEFYKKERITNEKATD